MLLLILVLLDRSFDVLPGFSDGVLRIQCSRFSQRTLNEAKLRTLMPWPSEEVAFVWMLSLQHMATRAAVTVTEMAIPNAIDRIIKRMKTRKRPHRQYALQRRHKLRTRRVYTHLHYRSRGASRTGRKLASSLR